MFAEETVLAAIAAQHVSDERVADVGEVATDLMGPAGFGADAQQAVAGRGIGSDRAGNLRRGQAGEFGPGFLHGPGFGLERGVDESLVGGEAPRHGQVGFGHLLGRELEGQDVGGPGGKGHDHQARRGAVQAVHRVEASAEPVAQDLEQEGFASGVGVAVHQQPGGLVHGDEMVVPVQDLDLSPGHGFRSVRRAGSWACAP